jgi:phage-related protein
VSGKPIRIAFLGDTRDLEGALGKAEGAMKGAADTAVKEGRKIDSAFDSTAGAADNVASKGSQAAGALSGLGGLAATQGGALGSFGAAAVVAGTATQALADSGDLLNVVTESAIVKKGLDKAATVGSTIATVASTAATKAATAGQWLLNAALSANPVGLVVAGIILLVGALFLAYKKSETFRNIVNGVFASVGKVVGGFVSFFTHAIPNAIGNVVSFVKAHWKPIVSIILGPVGLLVVGITSHLDDIKDGFNNTVAFVAGIPGRIRNLVGRFGDAGGALISGLVHGLSNPVGGIGDIASSILNAIIDFLNSHLPHSIPINNGPIHLSVPLFPYIPRLATGGVTNGPTLALIGDNPGGREAVIPLDKYDLAGKRVYEIHVTAPVGADAYTIGETIVGYIEEYENGRAA